MSWRGSIRQFCQQQWNCMLGMKIFLTLLVLGEVGVLLYFLIDRHHELYTKTIFRISLFIIENLYILWWAWRIDRLVMEGCYATFIALFILFFPTVLLDLLLQLGLYFKFGKDNPLRSKVENDRFPGSEAKMVDTYFQQFFLSFFISFFAQIGILIFRVIYCREGRPSPLTQQQIRQYLENRIQKNSADYSIEELREKECSICQVEMFQNEEVVKLSCQHFFHKECVLEWFSREFRSSGVLRCPNCRNQLQP